MKILRILLVIVLVVVAGRAFNVNAQTETNLHSFVGRPTDGEYPQVGLVQGSDGNIYGTTESGGSNSCNCGTVFRISSSGNETNLYSFAGHPNDGQNPLAMVQGSDGNFYGMTEYGGTNGGNPGYGTIFRISPSGAYSNLYQFAGPPNDGKVPLGPLVQGSDGSFYGTTYQGGTQNSGTVFRISPGGNYTNLYSFGNHPNDGAYPFSGLVQVRHGANFYGTTWIGGTSTNCNGGCGTVFFFSPEGIATYTNLYSFGTSPTDGELPYTGLMQGSDGNFYGTTYQGGTYSNGTVFRISPSGSYASLYSFVGYPGDGSGPDGALVQGSDGNFYGTTVLGGTNDEGTLFQISPGGSETNLHSFVGHPTDGADPYGALVQGSDGSFYGMTYEGGTNNEGTVFKLTVPLNPPANQISGIRLAGANIVFNIPSVAGETYQLQFSNSLTPTNWVNEGGTITSIGSILTLTNFAGANQPQGFYRFAITP